MLQLNGGKGSVYAVQGQRVDLGAIAKGYIADRVCAFIKKEGVKSAIVDLGGNLAVVGRPFRFFMEVRFAASAEA